MSSVTPVAKQPELNSVDIHDVLSNERRQHVLEFLHDAGGSMTTRTLSEDIAVAETGEAPPPTNIRQSVYVSLHQTHLPKLDKLGIVDYDKNAKTVDLKERAEAVSVYMETVPRYGLAWSEYYIAVSVLGLLLIVAGEIGVPLITTIGSLPLAVATFLLIMGSAAYQTYSQGSFLFYRL